MSLKSDIEELLSVEGINVDDRTARVPFCRVTFGGLAGADESLSRGELIVYCVVSWGQDVSVLAAQVWRALRHSGSVIPVAVVSQDPPPVNDTAPKWSMVAIVCDGTDVWYLE